MKRIIIYSVVLCVGFPALSFAYNTTRQLPSYYFPYDKDAGFWDYKTRDAALLLPVYSTGVEGEEYAQADDRFGDSYRTKVLRDKAAYEAGRRKAMEAQQEEREREKNSRLMKPKREKDTTAAEAERTAEEKKHSQLLFGQPPFIEYTPGNSSVNTTRPFNTMRPFFEKMAEAGLLTLNILPKDLTEENDTYTVNGQSAIIVPKDKNTQTQWEKNINIKLKQVVHPLGSDKEEIYRYFAQLRHMNIALKNSKIPPGLFSVSANDSLANFFVWGGNNISHFDLASTLSRRGKNEPRVFIRRAFPGASGPTDSRIPLGSQTDGFDPYAGQGNPPGLPNLPFILQDVIVGLEFPFGPTPQRSVIPFVNNDSTIAFLLNLNHEANERVSKVNAETKKQEKVLRINLTANPLWIVFSDTNNDGNIDRARLHYKSRKAGNPFPEITYDEFVKKMIELNYLVEEEASLFNLFKKGGFFLNKNLLSK